MPSDPAGTRAIVRACSRARAEQALLVLVVRRRVVAHAGGRHHGEGALARDRLRGDDGLVPEQDVGLGELGAPGERCGGDEGEDGSLHRNTLLLLLTAGCDRLSAGNRWTASTQPGLGKGSVNAMGGTVERCGTGSWARSRSGTTTASWRSEARGSARSSGCCSCVRTSSHRLPGSSTSSGASARRRRR